MPRPLSRIAPDWWDYTTLAGDLIRKAAALSERDLTALARPGFRSVFYDTLEDFYLAEAMEYITAGSRPRPTIQSASAGRSARRSSCRSSPGSCTPVRYVLPRHKAANWVGPGRSRTSTRPGVSGVVELSPFEFLDRLTDLVPPPRKLLRRDSRDPKPRSHDTSRMS